MEKNIIKGYEIKTPELMADEFIREGLPETFSESRKEEEEKFTKRMGNNINYLERLNGTKYTFSVDGFSYIDMKNSILKKISNVYVVPIEKINVKTVDEDKSFIKLKGFIAPEGEELPEIIIPINNIESGSWFVNSKWGLKVNWELPVQKNIQIKCIKEISKYMEEQTIYQYTGFETINERRVFLHTGGVIGSSENIKVDLGDEILNKYSLTNKEFDIKETMKFSLQCMNVAPQNVTVAILGDIYLAPLNSIFEELGIPIGFLTWVQGPQQSKKTSMVSALCSHFGNFNKNESPMSFLDGIPSIKLKAAKLNGVVALLDDFFPSSNKQEASEMKKLTETVISLCADNISGARSRSNGEFRKNYRVRCQIIATRRNISRT